MAPYLVQLKQFEGPLDLLLHLISRAQVDICDIFISEITEQYLASMEDIASLEMDAASEFLAMAATLLEIKSRALLPKPPKVEEGEETPEEALIRRLTEYKALKEGIGQMQAFERAASTMFNKLPEEYPLPPPSFELTNLTMDGLLAALRRVWMRAQESPERVVVAHAIQKDRHSVESCMFLIRARLRSGPCAFESLFSPDPTREEIVSLFIALLELLKLGRLSIRQTDVFGEIMIEGIEDDKHGPA